MFLYFKSDKFLHQEDVAVFYTLDKAANFIRVCLLALSVKFKKRHPSVKYEELVAKINSIQPNTVSLQELQKVISSYEQLHNQQFPDEKNIYHSITELNIVE